MKEIKVLKEAWDGMVQEGILDVITGKTDTQQNTDANQQQSTQPVVDPVKAKKLAVIEQQIIELNKKLAPLAEKKAKLEAEKAKLQG